jgi:ABC-type transporter Mla MlaB component
MATAEQVQRNITINEDMTIYNAAAQKAMLLEALADCEELDMDLSQVSEMDTAGFQILLLTKREALKANKAVRL